MSQKKKYGIADYQYLKNSEIAMWYFQMYYISGNMYNLCLVVCMSNVTSVMIVRGMMGQRWLNRTQLKSGYYPGVSEKVWCSRLSTF